MSKAKEILTRWKAAAEARIKSYDEEMLTATKGRKAVLSVWRQMCVVKIKDIELGFTEIEMGKMHGFASDSLREASLEMPAWGTYGT